jgi:IS30 family transposase
MNRLDPEARMTIKTLAARGATNSHIARLLGVTEGAVRHHVARLQARSRFQASVIVRCSINCAAHHRALCIDVAALLGRFLPRCLCGRRPRVQRFVAAVTL